MRKSVATAMLAGSLLTGGAIGSALFSAGPATAQSSSSDSSSSSSSTAPDSGSSSSTAPAPGPRGFRGGPGHGGPGMMRGAGLDVAASTIGVTVDELRAALESGQSIADVANAHGVDPQTVIDAMVADAKTHLADEVTEGHLTQEQADSISADLEQRITDLVNHTGGPGPGCPGMDGSGPGAPGSNDSNSSSSSSTPQSQGSSLNA